MVLFRLYTCLRNNNVKKLLSHNVVHKLIFHNKFRYDIKIVFIRLGEAE